MSYWKILGIDETSDLRSVKRAYAAKLKKTKPDEDPEGFKALHAAYKWACRYAKANSAASVAPTASVSAGESKQAGEPFVDQGDAAWRDSGTAAESPVEPHQSRVDARGEVISAEEPEGVRKMETPVVTLREEVAYGEGESRQGNDTVQGQHELTETALPEADEEYAFLQGQWDELTRIVDHVTASSKAMNDLSSWQFLDDREALFDIRFKSELSSYIFARIADSVQGASATSRLDSEVLNYLNSLFFWSERRDMLEDEFGFDVVDAVLLSEAGERLIKWTSPKAHSGELYYGNYFARIFATVADLLLLYFAVIFMNKFAEAITGNHYGYSGGVTTVLITLCSYLCLSPLLESTPLQGTLGKVLFGIKVVSRKGRRLTIPHAIFRSVLFGISTAAFKITVWINFFTNDGRLIHDRLSSSIVVKR